MLPEDPPRSAYVHVPFCRHRCGYCNFTLVAGRDDLIEAYLQALKLELATIPERAEIDTLYLGGGTPTHLSPQQLEQLLQLLTERFQLAGNYEFTVEANPLDLDSERAGVLAAWGVNRLSLGVQSFHDAKLAILERDHRRHDCAQAIAQARAIVPSLSLDLIYATPGETLAAWEEDLATALATGVNHISVYGLTIEPGSAFFGRAKRGELVRTEEPLEAEMYELAIDLLAAAGIHQYEVSNFAQPGHASRHNQAYWRGRSYYACGPGAARYVRGVRETNHRSTTTWLKRVLAGESPVAESETLSSEERARERLVFGLRMLAGVDRREFLEETGYSLESLVGKELPQLLSHSLLTWSGERLHLTRPGLLVSDSLWPRFL